MTKTLKELGWDPDVHDGVDRRRPKVSGTTAAAKVCEDTAAVIKQRCGTHGDAFDNLEDIARRWSNYLNGAHGEVSDGSSIRLSAADVAYMMVEMKLSRAMYGDNAEIDHLQDIVGYGAIGCAYLKERKQSAKPHTGGED